MFLTEPHGVSESQESGIRQGVGELCHAESDGPWRLGTSNALAVCARPLVHTTEGRGFAGALSDRCILGQKLREGEVFRNWNLGCDGAGKRSTPGPTGLLSRGRQAHHLVVGRGDC